MDSIKNYPLEQRKLLDYWFTAIGLSYGKTLDADGNLTHETGKPVDMDGSRRVEFRIITKGEEVLEKFVKENDRL